MAIIAVDMDDVLADTLGKILRVYNQRFGHQLTKESLTTTYLREVLMGKELTKVRALVTEPDFFVDLEILPGAQECLEKLARQHSIFIASAAMEFPTSFASKFTWLERHFSFISPRNIVFCGDKSIIHADYLIDDQPRYLKSFRGQGILFEAPHNREETGYPRVANWAEVEDYFERLSNGKALTPLELGAAE